MVQTLNRHNLNAPCLLGYDIDSALILCWAIPETIFYSPDFFYDLLWAIDLFYGKYQIIYKHDKINNKIYT